MKHLSLAVGTITVSMTLDERIAIPTAKPECYKSRPNRTTQGGAAPAIASGCHVSRRPALPARCLAVSEVQDSTANGREPAHVTPSLE